MLEHIRILSAVLLIRSLVELSLGGYILLVTHVWQVGAPSFPLRGTPEPGDRIVLVILGGVLVGLGLLRLVQASASLFWRLWARPFGLTLATIDFVTPITLPFALWGIAIYRHPETVDQFRRRQKASAR